MYKAARFGAAFIAAMVAFPLIASAQNYIDLPLLPVAEGNQWIYIKEGADDLAKVYVDAVFTHQNQEYPRIWSYQFPFSPEAMFMLNDFHAQTWEVNVRALWPTIPDAERTAPALTMKGLWYYSDSQSLNGQEYTLPKIGTDCFNGARATVVATGNPVGQRLECC